MGLRPLFQDHAERIANEQGWAVCVFELWPGREDLPIEARLEQGSSLSDERILADASSAADVCDVEPVGVTGFCMGGMFTLKAAGTGRFQRAVSFYGMIRVPEAWRSAAQREPLETLASHRRCATMAIIGTADVWTPPDDVTALDEAGVSVVRYEGAEHGFAHDPSRPAHRPDDAADAWKRALVFLGEGSDQGP